MFLLNLFLIINWIVIIKNTNLKKCTITITTIILTITQTYHENRLAYLRMSPKSNRYLSRVSKIMLNTIDFKIKRLINTLNNNNRFIIIIKVLNAKLYIQKKMNIHLVKIFQTSTNQKSAMDMFKVHKLMTAQLKVKCPGTHQEARCLNRWTNIQK